MIGSLGPLLSDFSSSSSYAYKKVLVVAVATEDTVPHTVKVKEYLKDQRKFAVVAPPVIAVEIVATPAAKVEGKKERTKAAEARKRNIAEYSAFLESCTKERGGRRLLQ